MITITTDVFCDGPNHCPMWIQGSAAARSQAVEARRIAKEHGWVRRNGKDLCPDCAAELKGE